jgi:hypothetical protein
MNSLRTILTAVSAAALIAAPILAQTPDSSPSANPATAGAPSAEDMQKMMELGKLNENHKLLTDSVGTWSYTVKMWMNGDPTSKPDISKGTAIRKAMMDGRYVVMDVTGKMDMPGPDGKVQSMTFKGHGLEGYDNVKKKFVGTWMDNMGTGIMMSEGDYDPATNTFTYNSEMEPMPGMKTAVREVLKMTDKDHMNFEWYEKRGGQDVKTMEINYTRSKK